MALKKIPGVVVEPLVLPTYLALVEASVDSPLFRTFYAKVNGKRTNVVRDGKVSCAFHVTGILKLFNLVQEVQITNNRAVRDMLESGWRPVSRPRAGCVVLWDEKDPDPERMRKDKGVYQPKVKHCGFYLGKGVCVSNFGDRTGMPWRHAIDAHEYGPVEGYLWHPALAAGSRNPAKPAARRKPGIYWHPNK